MEFECVIDNFVNDISISFPEYIPTLNKWWKKDVSKKEKILKFISRYCYRVYKPLYHQLMIEDETLFDGDESLELLPQICFRKLWKCNLSIATKKCLWGHIKLVCLLSEELSPVPVITPTVAPDNTKLLNNINNHFKDSKIGDFIKDISENILNDKTLKSPMDLLSDPTKLMKIMEKTQTMLTSKIESGDINENDLLSNVKDAMSSMGSSNPMLNNLFGALSSQMGMNSGESIDEILKEK
jgi:hypothetical protein